MKLLIASALLLVLGVNTAVSQDVGNIGACVDILTQSIQNHPFCDAFHVYMKCVVKTLNLHQLGLNSQMLQVIQSQMDTEFAKFGQSCDINIEAIVQEVINDENAGITSATTRPKTFQEAETLGECISALTRAAVSTGSITCPQARDYTKCALRVLNFLDSNPTAQDIEDFKSQMDSELQKQGIYCDLNVESLIEELRAEARGEVVTSRPDNTTPVPEYTEKPKTEAPFNVNDLDFDKCAEIAAQTASSSESVCSTLNKALKCVFDQVGNSHTFTDSELGQLQQIIENVMLYQGVDCSIDVKAAYRQRNGASALHAVSVAVVTIFSMFLVQVL